MTIYDFAAALTFAACLLASLAAVRWACKSPSRPHRWVEADNEAAARGPAFSASDVLDGLPAKFRP